jgi:hypothetical protein
MVRWSISASRAPSPLTHHVFRITDKIADRCCGNWNWLLAETGRVHSLCSYPWLTQINT